MEAKLTPEEESKDRYFREVAKLSEKMIAEHGKDFSMGTLVLAAQWIAQGKLGTEESAASSGTPVN